MATIWETPSSVWLEDEATGQFQLSSYTGLGDVKWTSQMQERIRDIASLIGAALPQSCQCSPIYPETFAHCPQCGAPLKTARSTKSNSPEWWGPYGDQPSSTLMLKGLPISALRFEGFKPNPSNGSMAAKPHRTLVSPPLSPCVFASARFGMNDARLIALAYTQNALHYLDPEEMRWMPIFGNATAANLTFSKSAYYWVRPAAAQRGDVAVIPTDTGLYRLRLDPVNALFHTLPVFSGELVTAPGEIRGQYACLIKNDRGVHLWTAREDGSGEAVVELIGNNIPDQGWSRPVSYNGTLIWLHADGHAVWKPNDNPQWIAWTAGWEPKLNYGGAVQSKDGRLWLIGQDRQGLSYVQIGLENAPVERTDGARLGFGPFIFRLGHQIKEDPWKAAVAEDHDDEYALVIPLLLGNTQDRRKQNGLVLRIDQFTKKADAVLNGQETVDATLQWIGEQNTPLDKLRIDSPLDLSAFFHEGHLWIHHPDLSEIRGWDLKGVTL